MQNSQASAVVTVAAALGIGLVLATAGGAATVVSAVPSGAGIATVRAPGANAEVNPAASILSCTGGTLSDVSRHFGTTAQFGVTSYASSAWDALAGYLNEKGGTAAATPAGFTATGPSASRIVFTQASGGSMAVIVDRIGDSTFDWRFAARCVS